jgi:hypothetical protein
MLEEIVNPLPIFKVFKKFDRRAYMRLGGYERGCGTKSSTQF